MKKRLFICSGLRTPELREENETIAKIAEDVGFDVYLPQRTLPYGEVTDAVLIYETNLRELNRVDGMLVNINGLEYRPGLIPEGHGIAFEWGHAIGKKIPVLLYPVALPHPLVRYTASTMKELRQKLILMKENIEN